MNSDIDRMIQMIFGYWVTQIVHAAATFSVADHLAKGAKTAEDIAKAEGTDASATFRLLRTCASLGNRGCSTHGQLPGIASGASHARLFGCFHPYHRR